ncbi:MAG: hypothetical protein PHE17_06640 [Thiothrix sp.]|uniref:hypothetical protein n=1 Tax=Thiothrix sp. TaxID=1032 RepID=UPI0026146D0D|nr:hypothetical protein [Thiothrix sp.]MDD5392680.1 hypothetical protein [Thiothrix sp.]
MVIKSIRLMVLASCIGASLFFTSAVPAAESPVKGSVNLMATLKDAPAFTPVEWKVLRLDNNSTIKTTHAHSLNLPLSPGTYKAVASYQDVTRDRTFTVNNNGQVNIIIAMDK